MAAVKALNLVKKIEKRFGQLPSRPVKLLVQVKQ